MKSDRFLTATVVMFMIFLVIGYKNWANEQFIRIDSEIAEIRAELHHQIDRTDKTIEITRAQMDLIADIVFYDMPEAEDIEPALTQEDMHLIALVCFTEDNLHGEEGLKAVAQTVKNRLEDGRFGDTIAGICTADQFHGLRKGDMTVSDEALNAVKEVWEGEKMHDGLYFCTPATDPDLIKRGLVKTAEIGGHVYYKDKEATP